MKVMNLRCAHDHRFEGWFASDDEMHAQLGSGALSCPLCGDAAITRLPSAPHIVVSGTRAPRVEEATTPTAQALPVEQTRQAVWMHRLRELLAKTDDVGERFAAEARRIHYGEAEARAIRGKASAQEARELVDEGIEIMALPTPEAFKGTLQ